MDILDLEDQLDEKTKLLISKMEKEIESKDKEIDDLKITNNKSNLIEVTWEDLYTLLAKDFDFKNGILSIYFVETDKKNTYENLIQIKNTFSDIKAIEIIDDTQSRAIYPQLFW